MRILLCSNWFDPSVGGVETTSKIFAEEFTKAGSSVTVVTNTPGDSADLPYAVVRQPSFNQVRALAQSCDITFQNLISLKMLAAILPAGKPVAVKHASWMRRPDGSRGLENYMKLLATRLCTNIATSKAIADSIPVPSHTLGNPFEESEFGPFHERSRVKDIVYMGRLVSDKGCDLLLDALGMLAADGLRPTVTVIGGGPEESALKAQAEHLGLSDQVTFAGTLRKGRGEVVAQHRMMVVPSRWKEPFGLVALEGIAAGCAIVASEGGGLKEVGGPCGLYFPNGDVNALASRIVELLSDSRRQAELTACGPAHLEWYRPARVARRYLDLFESLL